MSKSPTRTENDPTRVRQLLLCLDGLRYSGAIFLAAYARVADRLRSFERALASGVPTSEVVLVVADLWSMVDAVHRMRLLVHRAPLLPKKAPEIRIFLDTTVQIEELRHYVQHINNEIGNLPPSSLPLWGAVSWVGATNESTCFTVATGSMHLAHSAPSLAYDRLEQKFVRRIEFSAGKTSIDVDALFQRVRSFDDCICTWASSIRFGDGQSYDYRPAVTPLIGARVIAPKS